ncbi:MAG: potassium transporter [Alphaproteobacteria bacterium]|nr:potassium transporter [Alphaproteobacteria bacterium]
MTLHDFLFGAFIYLTAAAISVPVAKRLGLGSVLGYLIAGILIGPYVLGLTSGDDVLHFAEFGVVMMLFIIGLELRPSLLWMMRQSILGLGGMQVVLTAFFIFAAGLSFSLNWREALAVGLILSLSSTAIVLQTLRERGVMRSEPGQNAFSVLLFQDISVIPMLAMLPLLTVPDFWMGININEANASHSMIDNLPAWQRAPLVLGALVSIIVAGRYVLRPAFRYIAESRIREAFTAAALLIVVAIALLMETVGLSPALGTFVAGVMLADSEYRVELEMDIEPFKGLLLGLFFMSVGASVNFALIAADPLLIAGLVVGLIVIKLFVLYLLGRVFRMQVNSSLMFACFLAQGSEFAFVLFSFATQNVVLTQELANKLIAVVAVSMALTPLLLIAYDKLIARRLQAAPEEPEYDEIENGETPAIIVGYGRFGMTVGRLLAANGIGFTVLEHDPSQIELLRKFGWSVYYGDASRPDLLHAAGAEEAKLLVIALDDRDQILSVADAAQKHFPHLKIFARAYDRRHAFELMNAGIENVYRETFGTSLEMGKDALHALGFRAYKAHRLAQKFRTHDEQSLREMAKLIDDEEALITETHKAQELAERLMREDRQSAPDMDDTDWKAPPPELRERG